MSRSKRIEDWVMKLNAEQMQKILPELVEFSIDAEIVSMGDVPYWSNTGEPLVEGQRPFED